jgi:hypothetical protein
VTHDPEHRIRAAKKSLPTPAESATTTAIQALRREAEAANTPVRTTRHRRHWLKVAYGVAAVAVLAGAFGLGVWVAPSKSSAAVEPRAEAPGFLPALGWDTQQTGITKLPQAPGAIASTIPILPADDVGGPPGGVFPQNTIASLTGDDVLINVIFYPSGELASVDAQFPQRPLPLNIDDATIQPQWEGQPNPNIPAYLILTQHNGYDVQVDVFFAQLHPTQAALDKAQAELNRLVVPPRSATPHHTN